MPVRNATPQDIPNIIELGRRMHAESVYRVIPFSDEKFHKVLAFACQSPRHCLLVYQRSNGSIDGFYFGNIGDYVFSDEVGAYDILFYVTPERRGGIAAHRLFVAFREWARAQGAKYVWPGTSTGVDVERTARFYRGMDLENIGLVFFGAV